MPKDQEMEHIYQTYAQYVYRYLLSLTHHADLAEELTAETFYRATYSLHRYDGSCKISVWLCQIAKHLWYQQQDKRRRRRTQEPLPDDAIDPGKTPEQQAVLREEKMALYQAIHSLHEPMREVVHLRLSGEFSFAEIGEILGKTENWARVTFYRAKQKIMEEI